MKPNFALTFTDNGISLLHRSGRGWLLLGSASVADPAMADGLGYLRTTALGLEPNGISTKLVLPDAQILYTRVDVSAPEGPKRRAAIRRALDGRTPYALDDLVFDWSGAGPTVQVAVVARETLHEAEAFARQHKFNPVSFTANPDPAVFDGEPFFGATTYAAETLPDGTRVERDRLAMRIIATETVKTEPPAPPDAVTAAAEPEVPASSPDNDLTAAPEPVAVSVAAEVANLPPEPETVTGIERQAAAARIDASLLAEMTSHQSPDQPLAEDPIGAITPDDFGAPPPAVAPNSPPVGDIPDLLLGKIADIVPEAPGMFDIPSDDDGEDATVAQGSVASVAFSSRRDSSLPNTDQNRLAGVASRLGLTAGSDAQPHAAPRIERMTDGLVADVTAPGLPDGTPAPALTAPLRANGKTAGNGRVADPRAKLLPGKVAGPTATVARFVPLKQKGAVARANDKLARAAGMSAAIAAPSKTPPKDLPPKQTFRQAASPKGKPRYLGLFLTLALLMVLAAAAIWASFLAPSDATSAVEPEPATAVLAAGGEAVTVPKIAAVTAPLALSLGEEPAPAPAPPIIVAKPADTSVTPVLVAEPALSELAALAVPATETAPIQVIEAEAQTAAAEPAPKPILGPPPLAAEASNATLSPSQGPDSAPVAPDETDMRLATSNAPAQLAPTNGDETDALPVTPLPPAPFGTFFDRDTNGFVVATKQGALTPEGAIVFAGKPPVLPAPRPATAAQAGVGVVGTAGLTPAVPAAPAADTPVASDPALAGFRPRARPVALAAPQDQTLLSPTPQVATEATIRPKPRPADGAMATAGDPAPAPQDQAAPVAAEVAIAAASPLAVAASRRPAARIRDFSDSVAAALATIPATETAAPTLVASAQPAARRPVKPAAPAAPVVEPAKAAVADTAPIEGDAEPELASVAPAIPTKASVAKQATQANAINLNKLNLIGVYGTSSDRRALVRLSTGKYVRLKVGDRVDGGKVAAIGEQELRYVKNGRNLVLALPKEG